MDFGDKNNDNDLLAISGKGVCMLNGSQDTKDIADDITDKVCQEDGWADYIEKYIPKESLLDTPLSSLIKYVHRPV